MKNLIITALFVALPFLWVLSTPNNLDNFLAESTTQSHLEKTKAFIESFRKQYQRLPIDLNEIRLFALANHKTYTPYDGYSLRLMYQPISPLHYILKSFGPDNAPNTILNKEDQTVLTLGEIPQIPPVYVPPSKDFMQLYPAICLAGCKSPTSDFVAQVDVDRVTGKRFLLVRHLTRHKFVMIASHPRVEEYFWLQNGYEIVYTATNDSQYRDGIFLWNLMTDETRNIMDDFDPRVLNSSDEKEQPKYCLSLSSLSSSGRKVHAFIQPRIGAELDPGRFFSISSLYAIQIGDSAHPKSTFSRAQMSGASSIFSGRSSLTRDVTRSMQGTPFQTRWASLPLEGKMAGMLEAWQDFSMSSADSPIFPYSLWWLGFIYSDAYRVTLPVSAKHALTLKAFGAEISGALVSLNQAPSHLRAMGMYAFNHMSSSSALPYSLVNISAPTKTDLNN